MDRVNRIESGMADKLPNPRFIPFAHCFLRAALTFVVLPFFTAISF